MYSQHLFKMVPILALIAYLCCRPLTLSLDTLGNKEVRIQLKILSFQCKGIQLKVQYLYQVSNTCTTVSQSVSQSVTQTVSQPISPSLLQGTKKFRSDSPGLVDLVVGLMEFILHLPDGQVKVFRKFLFEIN